MGLWKGKKGRRRKLWMLRLPEAFYAWTKEFDWSYSEFDWSIGEGIGIRHWISISFGNFGVVFRFNGNFSYLMPFDKEGRSHTIKHCEKARAKK
jgi:hypothetical protein